MTAAFLFHLVGSGLDLTCRGEYRPVGLAPVLHLFLTVQQVEQLWDAFQRQTLVMNRPDGAHEHVYRLDMLRTDEAGAMIILQVNLPDTEQRGRVFT